MTSTSCKQAAEELLARCLEGKAPDFLPTALLEDSCSQALFGVWVEGLADRFEPALCDCYARLFAQAVGHVDRSADPRALMARYERVRHARAVTTKPRRIFVLSRVTLGADVAVTSVLLAAARTRFPDAEIILAGPRKNYELFAADPALHHVSVDYRRGSLRERLAAGEELQHLLTGPDLLIIDSDSRLTQLGLLPVCDEDRYHFFESRAYGGVRDCSLPVLAAEWAAQTFAVTGAKPFLAPAPVPQQPVSITVSLGVGENPAKRIPDPFEEQLLALLAKTGQCVAIDVGAGGSEAERVRRAVERSGIQAILWEGSFAGFAALIAGSRLYVGYDSAGQHVAAACGVPLISVFAGFPSARMFARWRPGGQGSTVIRVDRPDPGDTIERVREALEAYV